MRMLEVVTVAVTSTLLCVLVYILYKLFVGPQDGDRVVVPTELHEIDQWEIERMKAVDQWERWREENER